MTKNNWTAMKHTHERLLAREVKDLSDVELLAAFIHDNQEGKATIEIAHKLLRQFGGIRNLFDTDKKMLCDFPSIGKIRYCQFQAALEISRRYLEEQIINTNVISNAETAYLYLTAKLRDHKREVFACLFLNSQNRVIHYEEIFYGTINNTTVYPREIAKIALYHNASGIILAHNHPSGTPHPSHQDKNLTRTLIKILRPLDIKVLDHIIIGCNSYTPMINACPKPKK